MAYHDKHSPSIGPKTVLLLFTLAGLIFSYKLLLVDNLMFQPRTCLLLSYATIFYLRLVLCILFFVKRKIRWFEGCSVGVLYGALVYMFSLWGSLASYSIGVIETIGGMLFVSGSWVNTQSDFQRYIWKKKPENDGHLYTGGLFRYAMHINFLGDIVMFVGYALVTHNTMSFIPVTAILLNFIVLQIPRLDDYLLQRYGNEFTKYAKHTKKLIPFVY
jgi:protein-S-isoprenylcysteine O-methyltransferase Ste14